VRQQWAGWILQHRNVEIACRRLSSVDPQRLSADFRRRSSPPLAGSGALIARGDVDPPFRPATEDSVGEVEGDAPLEVDSRPRTPRRGT